MLSFFNFQLQTIYFNQTYNSKIQLNSNNNNSKIPTQADQPNHLLIFIL